MRNLDRKTVDDIKSAKDAANTLNRVDLRSWESLPQEINMATVSLPKGKYNIIIKYLDKNGKVVETKELKTKIREDKEPSTEELFQMFYKLAGIVSDVVYLPK